MRRAETVCYADSMSKGVFNEAGKMVRACVLATGLDRWISLLTQGGSPCSFFARLAPRNIDYSSPETRTVVRGGLRYELDLSDFMEWTVYFGLVERKSLLALVRPGMTVVDVGANIGEVSAKFSKAVGESGRVISFEPGRLMFKKLEKTLALNGLRNVTANNLGLGDRAGEFHLTVPCPTNRGGSRIHSAGGESVRVVTFDEVAENLTRLDLMKIDVEGFEMKVLKGAEKALTKFRPALFVELADENLREQGSSARELVTFLERLGYKITNAQSGESVASSSANLNGIDCDVICISPAVS